MNVFFVCIYNVCFYKFLCTVYNNTRYINILNYCAKVSILRAIDKNNIGIAWLLLVTRLEVQILALLPIFGTQ